MSDWKAPGLYADRAGHLDENSIALNDLIIVKVLKQPDFWGKKMGFWLPEASRINTETLLAEVVSVGPDAEFESIFVGDVIVYDAYSAYFHPTWDEGTFAITNVENIVLKIEDVEDFYENGLAEMKKIPKAKSLLNPPRLEPIISLVSQGKPVETAAMRYKKTKE